MIVLRTFGTAAIEIADSIVVTPNAPRRFAVLLYLAVERDREISREQLTSLVFSDQTSSEAAHSLREVMYQLRRSGAPIVGSPHGFMMSAEDIRADYDDAMATPVVEDDVLRAMAGGFLPAFNAPETAESYSEWLDGFRAEQSAALSRRMLAQVDEAMRAGRWESAQRAARACLGLDPWNERATFALAELLAIGGSKATALQLLDRYIAEVGPQSRDLSARASVLRRRISEGTTATLLGAASRNGIDAFGTGSPRLVGREAEMSQLLETFEHTNSGESQCVVVAGEAGIGKTRLVADFSAIALLRGAHVERVTIQPHDGDRPMGAFVDLVPALLETNGALGCSPESMGALRNLIGKRAPGNDAPQQVAGAEEHEQRWSAVSRAVVDLCEAIASEQTLVLVIEDAHWLDALSANTIGRIVGTKRKARIMVIATTREPRVLVREIRLTERCQTIALPPLVPTATDELLNIVLPTPDKVVREERPGEGMAAIKARIASISAGNPLFLISLAAHSRAHRGPFRVPGTIVETFAQRIDGLSRRGLSVLATCAELGKHSTIKRLMGALEMRKHEMVESLLELTDAGLVLRDGQNAVPAHPLVAEALRSRLAEPARRAVAHSVAETLEQEAVSRQSPALWWDAAESWRAADSAERLIGALRQCAHHALEFGRPGEAAKILNEAASLPQSAESLAEVGEALVRAGHASNDYMLILRGADLRRRVSPSLGHDDLEVAEHRAALRTNYSAEAADQLLECVDCRDATSAHRLEACIALLKASDSLGRPDLRARVRSAIASEDLAQVPALTRLEYCLLVAVTAGEWTVAADFAAEVIHECESQEFVNPRYMQNAAIALLYAGHWAEAIRGFEMSAALASEIQSTHGRFAAFVFVAGVFIDLERDEEARTWMDRYTSLAEEAPYLTRDFDLVTQETLAAFYSGDIARAEASLCTGDSLGHFADPVRSRWKRVLDLGLRSLRRNPNGDDEVEAREIAADNIPTMNGVRDVGIGVACQVLIARGHREEATAVLLNYFEKERAHCAPLPPSLARALVAAGPAPALDAATARVRKAAEDFERVYPRPDSPTARTHAPARKAPRRAFAPAEGE